MRDKRKESVQDEHRNRRGEDAGLDLLLNYAPPFRFGLPFVLPGPAMRIVEALSLSGAESRNSVGGMFGFTIRRNNR